MLTFEPFRIWYTKTGKPRTDIRSDCNLAPSTVAKIWKDGFPVRSDVIETLCRVYNLSLDQVIEYRRSDHDDKSK